MGIIFFALFQKNIRKFRQNASFFLGGILGSPLKEEIMNTIKKETIKQRRLSNVDYADIAKELGMTANAVRVYCYRHGLSETALKQIESGCKNCGCALTNKSKTRPRKFCSDACKRAWWNARRLDRKNANITEYTCIVCGKKFRDYISANRKYCSQACFWEGLGPNDDDELL